jgi:hypothetical protein
MRRFGKEEFRAVVTDHEGNTEYLDRTNGGSELAGDRRGGAAG